MSCSTFSERLLLATLYSVGRTVPECAGAVRGLGLGGNVVFGQKCVEFGFEREEVLFEGCGLLFSAERGGRSDHGGGLAGRQSLRSELGVGL